VLDSHLDGRLFLVGERCSIADLSVFAYTQVANQAGFELSAFPAVEAWLDRVRALPGFVADDLRYPENAQQGRSRSIYD
jgi:glutathione S-transferase